MANEIHDPPKVNIQLEQAIQAILSDRPIAYHAALARALGSVTAGVLLSQLLYWQPRSRDSEGWFWKTRDEIYDETGLTRFEQETARKTLVRAGVVEEKRRGVPAKMHFRVNLTRVVGLLSSYQRGKSGTPPEENNNSQDEPTVSGGAQLVGIPPSSWLDSHQLDGGKAPNQMAGNRQSITETTAETTSENNPETTNSNSFELFANLQKGSNSKFSKKRDAKLQNAGADQSRESRAQDSGKRAFTTVGQVLSTKRVPPPAKTAPRRPKTAPGSGPSTEDESYSVSAESGPPRPSRGRPPKATEQIEAVLEQISGEFHDAEHVRSNIGQAARLWKASGLSENTFVSRLYEARSITKQQGDIQKRASGEAGQWGARNRMPYFFVVVRDLLGMKNDQESRAART